MSINDGKTSLRNIAYRLIYCALVCLGAAILLWIANNVLMLFPDAVNLSALLSSIDQSAMWLALSGLVLFMFIAELTLMSYAMYKVWKLPRIIQYDGNSYYKVTGSDKNPKLKVRAALPEILAFDNMNIIKRKINLPNSFRIDLLIEDSEDMNAYTLGLETLAGGRHVICLSTALLKEMSSASVAAVIGHELGHVHHQDSATKLFMNCFRSLVSMTIFAPVYMIFFTAFILHWIFRFLPFLGMFSKLFLFLMGLITIILRFLELIAMWPARLYELHVSRRSEYLADAIAAASVGPLAICRVFFYLDKNSVSQRVNSLYELTDTLKILNSTHPPNDQRILAVQNRVYSKSISNLVKV